MVSSLFFVGEWSCGFLGICDFDVDQQSGPKEEDQHHAKINIWMLESWTYFEQHQLKLKLFFVVVIFVKMGTTHEPFQDRSSNF